MEVIIGLKIDVDEEDVKPRLGNRYGGKVEIAVAHCIAEVVNKFFNECTSIRLTHVNVSKGDKI